jgi:ATP/maltotriose-dependent transcriptional regulator MalT
MSNQKKRVKSPSKRSRNADGGQRETAILVRLSQDEKNRLRIASASAGYGLSTMLRTLGLEKARVQGNR